MAEKMAEKMAETRYADPESAERGLHPTERVDKDLYFLHLLASPQYVPEGACRLQTILPETKPIISGRKVDERFHGTIERENKHESSLVRCARDHSRHHRGSRRELVEGNGWARPEPASLPILAVLPGSVIESGAQ
jgi:hypothetical protein